MLLIYREEPKLTTEEQLNTLQNGQTNNVNVETESTEHEAVLLKRKGVSVCEYICVPIKYPHLKNYQYG